MNAAKNSVKEFLSKDGKHDTTVHENMAAAVTNETVTEHRHDNIVTALDKEIHQDHYHTTIQPIQDNQTLAEKHHFNAAAVEHRNFEHGNDQEVEARLRAEREKFKDTMVKGETKHTQSSAAPIIGEHVHHHVHENIQPVINRQTIEPHVIHTTIPIHEVHHSAAQHHSSTALPAISMADFKKQGGTLGGREARSEYYEGEPQNAHGHTPHRPGDASSEFRRTGHVGRHADGGPKDAGVTGAHQSTTATSRTAEGLTSQGTTGTNRAGLSDTKDARLTGSSGNPARSSTSGGTGTGLSDNRGAGLTGSAGDHAQRTNTGTSSSGTSGTGVDTTKKNKPSIIDRLNPFQDADGDGKKGIMD